MDIAEWLSCAMAFLILSSPDLLFAADAHDCRNKAPTEVHIPMLSKAIGDAFIRTNPSCFDQRLRFINAANSP